MENYKDLTFDQLKSELSRLIDEYNSIKIDNSIESKFDELKVRRLTIRMNTIRDNIRKVENEIISKCPGHEFDLLGNDCGYNIYRCRLCGKGEVS